ncbi:unnamed protein product [Kuraishia capsulata CBS 1993]|uniref:Uncharacterized protein n=1 Tax=Kuraishia capsulata CBS 1993 TaxID=1382522 RepID=W6MGI0_9ASCO|nr:uncharacterized protein KUCA_T00001186001 [Kuraishia capsulata CBS 1993]CDK25219.1 unnamed protein product [Kuraishia capsulata CBS 1993]
MVLIVSRQNLEKIRQESEKTQTQICARVLATVLRYDAYDGLLTVIGSDDLASRDESRAIKVDIGNLMLTLEVKPELLEYGSTVNVDIAVSGCAWPVYGIGLRPLADPGVMANPAAMDVLRAVANLESLPNVYKEVGYDTMDFVHCGGTDGEVSGDGE